MKKMTLIFATILLCFLAGSTAYLAKGSQPPEIGSLSVKSGRLYGIGSVSKVVTAAAVMKLVDEGKINLDEPLVAYIPEFQMADERYTKMTPRMLLSHSSGLMGMTDNNAGLLGDNDTYNHDHFLGFLKTQALKHDPGNRSIYSNDSFTLAEILVESVSGISFTDFIEQRFLVPLGLENIKTPQSDFDRSRLADIYMDNNELKPENLGAIGTGGIYATVEDLCRFATIFMDSADGSVLSRQVTEEMATIQHRMEMVSPDADTVCRYGLGWDAVETYPFTQYGIKVLSKGGATGKYHTNLTVLPAFNLAAAVSSSGNDSREQLIAQEIILAVLIEEGLIPEDAAVSRPAQNLERTEIPEDMRAHAGIYDGGMLGQMKIEFTDDTLILTPILVRNERPQEYIYNTDGEFVSTDGDYIGLESGKEGTRGITAIRFSQDGYLMIQTYEDVLGLSGTAMGMPVAKRLEENPVSEAAMEAWKARNDKEYLLVSEKHTSMRYISRQNVKTLTDDRAYGYVTNGIYKGSGVSFNMARIVGASAALGFQDIPTMTGRDTNNLSIAYQNGAEYLGINNYLYIDASAAKMFSEIGETLSIGTETVWVDIGGVLGGQILSISAPLNGSWFVYDDQMTCIATSLEKNPRNTIILPENGRLAFAGEAGATFVLK